LETDKIDSETQGADIIGGDEEKKERFDHDSFWKDLVDLYFYPLLRRAIPELYEDADIETEPRPLDKEFRDILNTGDPEIHTSPHFADFVLEVPLKNGSVEWIILHLELQGRGGGNLCERMNHYRCLIYAHYRREPAALAVITDKRPPSESDFYSHTRYGTNVVYNYNNLVLSELDDDELTSSENPIDLVLYAAKCALKCKKELPKFNFLRKAVGLLNERGWSLKDKRDLLLFIERIINMKDEGLIKQYKEFLEQHSKEGKAMYIPLILRDSAAEIEQRGREEGREKGKLEGKLEVARNLLARGISPDIIAESADLPLEKVRALMN
jgi:predicted transposase YdaD